MDFLSFLPPSPPPFSLLLPAGVRICLFKRVRQMISLPPNQKPAEGDGGESETVER